MFNLLLRFLAALWSQMVKQRCGGGSSISHKSLAPLHKLPAGTPLYVPLALAGKTLAATGCTGFAPVMESSPPACARHSQQRGE